MEIMKGVSIVICCYNSAKRLPETIKHLSLQGIPNEVAWEVIIVNNNSTDNTKDTALNQILKYEILTNRYKIIDEPLPGLNYARRKGGFTAKYNHIIFCDDDNWLSKDYITNINKIFNKYEALGIIGARNTYGVYEEPPKKWFLNHKHLCAIDEDNEEDIIGFSNEDKFMVFGAGMAIRKTIVIDYFLSVNKNVISDRTKDLLLSGGDTDMNHFALQSGYGIGKFISLHLSHYMPRERLNKHYLRKLAYGLSYSSALVAKKNRLPLQKWSNLGLIKHLLVLLFTRGFFSCSIVLQQNKGFRKGLKHLQ
ncbi:MAG: glycosyltransferase family 2 protein [Flavobacterium sp.]|nr:MAG: glycosyltransferase family 2 protein [Flavobacterium sp.]